MSCLSGKSRSSAYFWSSTLRAWAARATRTVCSQPRRHRLDGLGHLLHADAVPCVQVVGSIVTPPSPGSLPGDSALINWEQSGLRGDEAVEKFFFEDQLASATFPRAQRRLCTYRFTTTSRRHRFGFSVASCCARPASSHRRRPSRRRPSRRWLVLASCFGVVLLAGGLRCSG